MAACSYVQIKDLTLYSQSFFIAGLIIAKTERKILSSQWNGTKSGVITYTVRDTKEHFINCTIWGTEQYIENSNRANKIGDIVAIYRPVVVQNNSGSGYYPRTSSPFELTVKEGKAFIHRATDHFDYLLELQNQTIKSTILTLKLSDLNTNPDIGFLNADLLVFGMYSMFFLIKFLSNSAQEFNLNVCLYNSIISRTSSSRSNVSQDNTKFESSLTDTMLFLTI